MRRVVQSESRIDLLGKDTSLGVKGWQALFGELIAERGVEDFFAVVIKLRGKEQIMGAFFAVYEALDLREDQLTHVLQRYAVFANEAEHLKGHLICILDLECAQKGGAKEICNNQEVFFPEEVTYGHLLKALDGANDQEEYDLHVNFPMWVSDEERNGKTDPAEIDLRRAKFAPPREGNFERRGTQLKLRVQEARTLEDLLGICSKAQGKVRTLILGGHANPYTFGIRNIGGKETLNAPYIHSRDSQPIWDALLGRDDVSICYFACEAGAEGGVAWDSAERTKRTVLASDEEVSAMTLDFSWEEKKRGYAQFWTKEGRQFHPANTIAISV